MTSTPTSDPHAPATGQPERAVAGGPAPGHTPGRMPPVSALAEPAFVPPDRLPPDERAKLEGIILDPPGRPLTKYVFIQADPFLLPRVLDKFLREHAETTAGINIQSVAQGGRSVVRTALDLLGLYGPWYFQWKLRRFVAKKVLAKVVNDLLGSTRTCHSVGAVARRYGVRVDEAPDVNAEPFRAMLRDRGVEFIASISGTQLYRRPLREQTPYGIVNCHGALLPAYRGLMPSFWTLANGERLGGSSVHYVDRKLDNGPIIVQRAYRIWPHDSLEDVMSRSKDLAAEVILECVRKVEYGPLTLAPNPESERTHFSMPTPEDVRRFRRSGHRFN